MGFLKGNKFRLGKTPWNKGRRWPENVRIKMRENHKGMTGRKHSNETKKKIGIANSIALRGGKQSKETIEKRRAAMLGHFVSEKTRMKIGKANSKPHLNQRGERNGNWKGGITPINQKIRGSVEYKLWQDSVLSRDGWRCGKCGENRISKLMAHHILNFSSYIELRFAIDNGITFCRNCHNLFHRRYGIKNNTNEQVREFTI